jgi:predicted negative regulator of RcsB-dependent stress response
MEVKWFCIMTSIVFGGLFLMDAYQSHNTTQCRVAAIQSGVAVDKVKEVCEGIKR